MSTSPLQLTLNGESTQFDLAADASPTLGWLLDHLAIQERRGMAIAVNDSVVPKSLWDTHTLSPADHVEIIRATQGG